MIKKVFEDILISGMQEEMRKQASAKQPNLVEAAECLHAALEIFEESGMQTQADQVLNLLQKIANHYTKGLTPKKQVTNLKHHGTQFNDADDTSSDTDASDDLLLSDIKEDTLEVFDKNIPLADFEDEKD